MDKQDFDEVTRWVQQINALTARMDEIAGSIHPSAWHEELADLNEKYRKLAAKQIDSPSCGGRRN